MNTDTPDSLLKWCPRCENFLTHSMFGRDKNTPDKLCRWCRNCKNARSRELYTPKIRQILPEGMKRCSACEQLLPATLEYFSPNHPQKDGLRSECRPCRKAQEARNAWLMRTNDATEKYCPACKQVKPIEAFSRAKGRYDRRAGRCKACTNATYALKHQKKLSTLPPDQKRCTQCTEIKPFSEFHKQGKGYHSQCKKCRNAQRRQNRESEREYDRWQYKQNPEKGRIAVRTREALKNSVPGKHTPEQVADQLKRQKYRCYYAACGHAKFKQRADGTYIYHVEHTYPITRIAGSNIPANDMGYLVLACPRCNDGKGNKFPWEWPEGGRLL